MTLFTRRATAPLFGLAALSLSCGSTSGALGPDAPDPADLAILFVGNSLTYTNNLPAMVEGMFAQAGRTDVHVESVAYPNFGLQDHWVMGEALPRIDAGGWDIVILQQGPSATEGRPSLIEYSQRFDERVRAAGGRTALYMVWPAAARAFDFDGVRDSYRTAAQAVEGLFLPAGEAWRVAWGEDSALGLYGGDGFHPSMLGSYVAALVIFEQLADTDPRTLPPRIRRGNQEVDVDPETAALLQSAAVEANATWRLEGPGAASWLRFEFSTQAKRTHFDTALPFIPPPDTIGTLQGVPELAST